MARAPDIRTISPAEGRRVRHPGKPPLGGRLLTPGASVVWGSYWERLLAAGDIVMGKTIPADAPVAGAAPTVIEGEADAKGQPPSKAASAPTPAAAAAPASKVS